MLIQSDSRTKPWAIGAAFCLAFGNQMVSAASAAPTTTEEVGEAADFLMLHATCEDFNLALGKLKSPDKTVKEELMVMFAIMYIEGFAAGAGNKSGKRAETVVRCTMRPTDKFNTVVPGQ